MLPNGAVIDYQIDGYGQLYKTVADSGGLAVESLRRYFDADGVPSKLKKLLKSSPVTFAETVFTRNPGGYLTKSTDPTGVVREATLDALGVRSLCAGR